MMQQQLYYQPEMTDHRIDKRSKLSAVFSDRSFDRSNRLQHNNNNNNSNYSRWQLIEFSNYRSSNRSGYLDAATVLLTICTILSMTSIFLSHSADGRTLLAKGYLTKRDIEYPASADGPNVAIDGHFDSGSGLKYCPTNTPCGWAVYIPATRRVDYFMKNTCSCASEKICLKVDDDLSVSAYVYKCVDRLPSTESDAITTYSPVI